MDQNDYTSMVLEDVIDIGNIQTIDDIMSELPYTLFDNDEIYCLHIRYLIKFCIWEAFYENSEGKQLYNMRDSGFFECLKKLLFKINEVNGKQELEQS